MGCFNSVCNLSGLQIYRGDRVKLIVTLPPHDHSEVSLNHPSDLRIPCFLPVDGEYDDYGCIQNIDKDDLTPSLIDSYFKEAKINGWLRSINDWPYSTDGPYNQDQHDGLKWFKYINQQSFRVSRFPGIPLSKENDGIFASYSLILQEVWDDYIIVYDRVNGIRANVQDSLDCWFTWYDKIAAELSTHPDDTRIWGSGRWGRDVRYYRSQESEFQPPAGLKSMALGFMNENDQNIDLNWFTNLYFNNFLYPLFMAKAFEQEQGQRMWQWFRKVYTEFSIVCSLMHYLPRFWMPCLYAGQDREYKLHLDIATATRKIAVQRLTKYEKENEE